MNYIFEMRLIIPGYGLGPLVFYNDNIVYLQAACGPLNVHANGKCSRIHRLDYGLKHDGAQLFR